MAVYTQIEPAELDALLSDYDIGAPISLKGIAEGVENSNYLLETETGKYILTVYEKRVAPEDLPFFLDLKTHLAKAGIHCPVPIKRKQGGVLSHVKNRPAAIISFLEGASMRRPQVSHCFKLGQAMAQLHLAGMDFDQSRANNLSLDAWQGLFAQNRHQVNQVHPNMESYISEELALMQENWPQNLPTGIIHADLFIDNVFFLNDEVSGIIDFYFACTDQLVYDIAITLNAWCFEADVNFNITKAKAILEGYQTVRPLSEAEIQALPILSRGAALRFLLTRLHDWFNHDPEALVRPKNPTDYLRRLRFHKTATRPQDYGITQEKI